MAWWRALAARLFLHRYWWRLRAFICISELRPLISLRHFELSGMTLLFERAAGIFALRHFAATDIITASHAGILTLAVVMPLYFWYVRHTISMLPLVTSKIPYAPSAEHMHISTYLSLRWYFLSACCLGMRSHFRIAHSVYFDRPIMVLGGISCHQPRYFFVCLFSSPKRRWWIGRASCIGHA